MILAEWTLTALAAYLAVGLVFGLAFAGWGAAALDPAARGVPLRVRWMFLPGATVLWPLLSWRWWRGQQPPLS